MKLTFIGADHEVTGSCHLVEACGKNILVDCGMEQGPDLYENQEIPVASGDIDYILLTHAHIDHSGKIPMLCKQGFHGEIVTTFATSDLCNIMLRDSAHIQESDAMWLNRKGQRAGKREVEPLYTVADAMQVKEYLYTCEYGEEVALCDGVKAVFTDAGHLLGSASITLTLTEGDVTKTIVFSGDIGNMRQPIIRDPVLLHRADYVVMESTYGDREHNEVPSYTEGLAAVIDETLGKGGNVVLGAEDVRAVPQKSAGYLKKAAAQGRTLVLTRGDGSTETLQLQHSNGVLGSFVLELQPEGWVDSGRGDHPLKNEAALEMSRELFLPSGTVLPESGDAAEAAQMAYFCETRDGSVVFYAKEKPTKSIKVQTVIYGTAADISTLDLATDEEFEAMMKELDEN